VQPGVFGLVDHAHAPTAEPVQDAVVRDRLTHQRETDGIDRPTHRRPEMLARTALAGEERFHLPAQLGIAARGFVKQARALPRVALRSAMEQLLDFRPAFRSHEPPIHSAFRDKATPPPSSNHDAP